MSSVGKKLTLNFSKGRQRRKEHRNQGKMGRRRGSWDALNSTSGAQGGHDLSSSVTNLQAADGQILNQTDIIQLTQIVRSFTDALYKLKDVFNLDDTHGAAPLAEDVKNDAHEKLGELLCQLSSMKKFPAMFTSDVLMAVHHVITKVKLCDYDDVANSSDEVLDYVDKLAMCFTTSVSEYLMGGMDLESSISRSKSCDHLATEDANEPYFPSDKQAAPPGSVDVEQVLLRHEQAVDMALNRAKQWSKYTKDVTYYVEKRAIMEAEYAKNLAKLAHGVQQTISEDTFLPFQSIFYTALSQDEDYASQCQATYSLIQAKRFVDPLTERRLEHDKMRKQLKDHWNKELKKMHDAESALKKARTFYVNRHTDYEKAKEATQRAEAEGNAAASSQGSAPQALHAKIEKKKKQEEDCLHKAMDAETSYKSCVMIANNCQVDLEKAKADILAQTRELMFASDQVMKTATVGYFKLQHSAIAAVPSQFNKLREISENYEPGFQYVEYVKHLPPPSVPYHQQHFTFEAYNPDSKGLDVRKPSTQSSGSGSDAQHYGEESPLSRHQRGRTAAVVGTTDHESDSGSASSSRSTSPSNSPYINKRSSNISQGSAGSGAVSSESGERFRGVLLSPAACTHVFRKLRAPTRCRHCDSYVYFQGAECEKCGIASHKRCLETLTQDCGVTSASATAGERSSRRMTTFGVPVSEQVGCGGESHVPLIVLKCTGEIDKRALDVKGIYRVSGVKSRVEALCQSFENDPGNVDLEEHNPHVIANVLKLYLRQLPEPLLTFKLYPTLVQLAIAETNGKISKEELTKCVKDAMNNLLPDAIFSTLAHLMRHLARVVANEGANQMSASNLGIVFGPTLLRNNDGGSSLNSLMETPHQTHIVELLILNAHSIFGSGEKENTEENKNLLRADSGRGEGATTPVSGASDAGWVGQADITGNLLAELENDPSFKLATNSGAKTADEQDSEPTDQEIEDQPVQSSEVSTTNKQDKSPEDQQKTAYKLSTEKASKENITDTISSDNNAHNSTEKTHNPDKHTKSTTVSTTHAQSKPDISSITSSQSTQSNNKEQHLSTNTGEFQNERVNPKERHTSTHERPEKAKCELFSYEDTLNRQEKQPGDNDTPYESNGNEKNETNPAAKTMEDTEANRALDKEQNTKQNSERTLKSDIQNTNTLQVPGMLSAEKVEKGAELRTKISLLKAELAKTAGLTEQSSDGNTYSPGLKKKLLSTHVRKTPTFSSSRSASGSGVHLLQPRPYSFRAPRAGVTDTSGLTEPTPEVIVSSPQGSRKSRDDLDLPPSPKALKVKPSPPQGRDAFSRSATSSSSMLKELRKINQRGGGSITKPSTHAQRADVVSYLRRSPPYVSPYASPVVSPMVSPRTSPGHTPGQTPKTSPTSSPNPLRRNESPLTLSSDREPAFV